MGKAKIRPEVVLYDDVANLPSCVSVMDDLQRILAANHAMGMLYIDLSHLYKIEEKFGTETYETIITSITEIVAGMKGQVIRDNDLICVEAVGNPSPMIFLSEKRTERHDGLFTKENVEVVSDRVHDYIFSKLFYLVYPYLRERPRISVGFAYVVNNPLIAPARLIYNLIEDSKQVSRIQQSRHQVRNKERLQRIIVEEAVQTLFQPIVNLSTLEVIGYEALSRGPAGSEYESPAMLFSLARETGLLFELDRLCRKKALENAANIPKDKVVFVNTLPNTIHDPEFRGQYLKKFLQKLDLNPRNIVFEVTEASAIENYSLFREAVEHYTKLGINIAIDDTGTGYSTLESIIEICPQYLKFDMSLVRDIDKSMLKRELIKALISVSRNINATVVAEGIETQPEYTVLRDLGVETGQGFLFARPGPPFPDITRFKKS